MLLAVGTISTSSGLSLPGLVGLIGGILGILGLVASAAAVLRANYMRATIETLKESNGALTERNNQLDDQINVCNTRLAALEKENESLQTYVSGTEEIRKLADQMKAQHAESMALWGEVAETVRTHMLVEHARAVKTTTASRKRTTR